MEETPNQTPTGYGIQKESTYANSLFNMFTIDNMDEKNFSLFKKDFRNILLHLAAHMSSLLKQFTMDLVDNDEKRNNVMSDIYIRSKQLEEYCHFFRANEGRASLSYEYFGSVAHKLKTYGGSIDNFLISCKHTNNVQEKRNDFNEIKTIIGDCIKKINVAQKRVAHMEFKEQSFFMPELFSPTKETQDITSPYSQTIQQKNIEIANTMPDTTIVQGCKNIFEIVMDNLISNAIKFTPNSGKITIGIEEETDSCIKFFVQDSGPGVPSDVDPFAYGYTTPGLDGQIGTGLGLAQSKDFLKHIQGALWYKNIPEGGIRFSFELKKTSQKNQHNRKKIALTPYNIFV